MTNFFTRTLVSTEIQVAELKIGTTDLTVLGAIEVEGKVSPEKAVRIANKEYKGKQVVVIGLEEKQEKRTLSYEDFMKYSVVVVEEEVSEDEVEVAEESHVQ